MTVLSSRYITENLVLRYFTRFARLDIGQVASHRYFGNHILKDLAISDRDVVFRIKMEADDSVIPQSVFSPYDRNLT
jgi:hypothetical protein